MHNIHFPDHFDSVAEYQKIVILAFTFPLVWCIKFSKSAKLSKEKMN